MTRPTILALSGSLRRESFNTGIIETIAERLEPTADIRLHRYDDLPHYNQDDDVGEGPAEVYRLRSAVHRADALLIVTPEFNHGLPGVLKNALDWLSRPRDRCALQGKPVLGVTSSLAITGGVRAHAQLNETMLSVGSRMVLRPQAVIGAVHQKFREGRLVDEANLGFLDAAIADLLALARTPEAVS